MPRLVDAVPNDGSHWVHEMKLDGYRMQGHLKNGIATFWSRNELDWSNKFPFILNSIEKLPVMNAIFDGEVVALDENGRPDFQLLQNAIKSKNDKNLRYYIFDLLYLNGKDLRELPLTQRKEKLSSILKKTSQQIVYSEHFEEDGNVFFKLACEHKLEGIVSKIAESPYRSGRNDLWVKVKCTNRQEFVVGGWTDPKGGRSGLGALLLGVYEKGKLRYVGRVGTGFSMATLKDVKKELSTLASDKSPFDINSPQGNEIHWVLPRKSCEVTFSEWTKEGILRTPVFKGMREDKSTKEIHMEKAKKVKKKKHLNLVREISSPDKILFKKEGLTKQDVSDYYQSAAKVMLPYMSDRPLTLVRCPQGSSGTCFYQKHISGHVPDAFYTVAIKEENGEGIYIAIDSSEGLQELVQLNAYEIHAWNSHRDDYLAPDQIVMDLDPGPGVSWSEVVEAAFELRKMLLDLDLESFVKVTGGKGLHLHIPVLPLYSWDQIKSFAQSLALEMVRVNPERYTANMSKKQRNKRIFIDYLRNGYSATAVVPYSLRAKDKSAVAMPLDWNELRRIKGPQEFSMEKALKKIKGRKKDPWERMLKLKQKISILEPLTKKKRKAS